MGRKPANACVSAGLSVATGRILAKTCRVTYRNHMRPIAPGERTCDREAELEDGVEVDVAFGQGHNTLLSGEICKRTRE